MTLDFTNDDLRNLLASVGVTFVNLHEEDPNCSNLPALEALYTRLRDAVLSTTP